MQIKTLVLSLFSILILAVSVHAATAKQKITLVLNDKQYAVANLNYSVSRDNSDAGEDAKKSPKVSTEIYLSANLTGPVDKTLLKWLSDSSSLDGKFIIQNGENKREVLFKKGSINSFNENFSNSNSSEEEGSGVYLDIRCETLLVDGFSVSGSGK